MDCSKCENRNTCGFANKKDCQAQAELAAMRTEMNMAKAELITTTRWHDSLADQLATANEELKRVREELERVRKAACEGYPTLCNKVSCSKAVSGTCKIKQITKE